MHRIPTRVFTTATLLLLSAGMVDPASALSAPQPRSGADGVPVWPLSGRVTLTDGEVVEGLLVWDRHASTSADLLRGLREVSDEGLRLRTIVSERTAADRQRSVDLPGVRVTWEEDDPDLVQRVRAGIRFAWIDRLVPDSVTLRVELRTGDTVDLQSSGTNIGPGFRGLALERPDGGVRSLDWDEIAMVELFAGAAPERTGRQRIHGTVEATSGATFTGWIVWDADETWGADLLEGDDDALRFDELTRIERRAGGGVEVTLASGERRSLSGTNDVDDDNRGIRVSDPGLGRVSVPWEAFDALSLHPPTSRPPTGPLPGSSRGSTPASPTGPAADGSPRFTSSNIEGVLRTRDGVSISGAIVWDLDEARPWHLLDGDLDGMSVAVEFSEVARVERSDDHVWVVLRDGRELRFAASGDLGPENRGIGVIDSEGQSHIVDWHDVESLDLASAVGGA